MERVITDDVDVVHAHGAYPLGLAAVLEAKRKGIPCVLTLHGSDVNTVPDHSERHSRYFDQAVRGATAVIAVSETLAEKTAERSGLSPEVLPIGVDPERFRRSTRTK